MSTIRIQDHGPIEFFEFPVPDGGGVVVLRGANGCGKSSALDAVETLVGRNSDLNVRDGCQKATVEGLGVTVTFRKRQTVQGHLDVSTITSKFDPSKIVDPGIIDPERKDAARVRELATLVGSKLEPSAVQNLAEGFQIEVRDDADPCKVAAEAKRKYEELARQCESDASRAELEWKVIAEKIGDFDQTSEAARADQKAIEAALDEAHRELIKLETRREEHAKALPIIDELRRFIDEEVPRTQQEIAELEIDVDSLREKHSKCQKETKDLSAQIEFLQRQREHVETIIREVERSIVSSESIILQRKRTIASAEQSQKRLSTLQAIEPVTDDAIASATARKDAIREQLRECENAKEMLADVELRESARERQMERQEAAERLRKAAMQCEEVLIDSVNQADTGLKMRNGRLVLATDRSETELFDELSDGERWRVAITACANVVGSPGEITIPQTAWEGLDPTVKAEIVKLAVKLGVVIVTAAADVGDLRAEVLT